MKRGKIGNRFIWVILAAMLGSPFVAFKAMAAQNIETVEPEIITAGVKHYYETQWQSYSYTEADTVTIDGEEYPGIVIPIHQQYAGGIAMNFYSDGVGVSENIPRGRTVDTTNGTVYIGYFEDENFTKDGFESALSTFDLFRMNGTEGTRYLVFYNELPEGRRSVTTNIKVQIAMEYQDVYTMEENVVSPNYSCDSQKHNSAKINISNPGYYMFEVSDDVKMTMVHRQSGSSSGVNIPAMDMVVSSKTDHKVILNMSEVGAYSLSMNSEKGKPFNISYSLVAYEEDEQAFRLSSEPIHFYLGDLASYGLLRYKAEKTGILQIAGLSEIGHNTSVSFFQKEVNGDRVGAYNSTLTVGEEITPSSKAFFYVEAGKDYTFSFSPTGKDGYVNADFKFAGFTEAKVLGEKTKEECAAKKEELLPNVTYNGTFDDGKSNTSWIYVAKPSLIVFENKKEKAEDGYTIDYWSGGTKKFTAYVVDDNRSLTEILLETWAPGYLEISNGSGRGYYTLSIQPIGGENTPGDNPGDAPGDNPGINPGDTPGDNPGDTPGDNPGDNPEINPGDTPGDNPGINPGDTPGDNSGNSPGTVPGNISDDETDISVPKPNTETNVPSDLGKEATIKGGIYRVTDIDKKEASFVAMANLKAKSVVVQATIKINGTTYKVTGIAANAFKNNKSVTKITVGKNVSTIGANAFSGCKKLKTITIKTTKLKTSGVAKKAFKGLKKTTTIKVPKKCVKSYKKLFMKKGLSGKVKIK